MKKPKDPFESEDAYTLEYSEKKIGERKKSIGKLLRKMIDDSNDGDGTASSRVAERFKNSENIYK